MLNGSSAILKENRVQSSSASCVLETAPNSFSFLVWFHKNAKWNHFQRNFQFGRHVWYYWKRNPMAIARSFHGSAIVMFCIHSLHWMLMWTKHVTFWSDTLLIEKWNTISLKKWTFFSSHWMEVKWRHAGTRFPKLDRPPLIGSFIIIFFCNSARNYCAPIRRKYAVRGRRALLGAYRAEHCTASTEKKESRFFDVRSVWR